ncbi:MAG: RidA family protein [Rhodospirillales bacterium]|nr:RidA family protein [Rhodospirillales bacterium]
MIKRFNVPTIAAPGAHFSAAVEIPPNARWLRLSGQVPVNPDGTIPKGIEAQAERVWLNIFAVLAHAGMSAEDLVAVTIFMPRAEDRAGFQAARNRMLGGEKPASTLITVTALPHPEYLVEIEAWAAKVDAPKKRKKRVPSTRRPARPARARRTRSRRN